MNQTVSGLQDYHFSDFQKKRVDLNQALLGFIEGKGLSLACCWFLHDTFLCLPVQWGRKNTMYTLRS